MVPPMAPQVVVVIDNRVSCETAILHNQEPNPQNHNNNKIEEDLPAESYCLAKEEELEWIDRNAYSSATFFDRKDSNKPTTTYHQTVQISSQRFKSKPSIIGLPKPPPNNTALRRSSAAPSAARFFTKRSSSSLAREPSSPKVSCIGRVRSKKCRSLRRRRSQDERNRDKSAGFWSGFRDALRLGCRKSQALDVVERSAAPVGRERRKAESQPAVGPPGLGGMNRFVSGRRSDAWAGELESADQGLGSGGAQEVC